MPQPPPNAFLLNIFFIFGEKRKKEIRSLPIIQTQPYTFPPSYDHSHSLLYSVYISFTGYIRSAHERIRK